jgi:hypothetical protein
MVNGAMYLTKRTVAACRKTSKGSIEERKIRVVFLPADGSGVTPTHNNVNGTVRSDTKHCTVALKLTPSSASPHRRTPQSGPFSFVWLSSSRSRDPQNRSVTALSAHTLQLILVPPTTSTPATPASQPRTPTSSPQTEPQPPSRRSQTPSQLQART